MAFVMLALLACMGLAGRGHRGVVTEAEFPLTIDAASRVALRSSAAGTGAKLRAEIANERGREARLRLRREARLLVRKGTDLELDSAGQDQPDKSDRRRPGQYSEIRLGIEEFVQGPCHKLVAARLVRQGLQPLPREVAGRAAAERLVRPIRVGAERLEFAALVEGLNLVRDTAKQCAIVEIRECRRGKRRLHQRVRDMDRLLVAERSDALLQIR